MTGGMHGRILYVCCCQQIAPKQTVSHTAADTISSRIDKTRQGSQFGNSQEAVAVVIVIV